MAFAPRLEEWMVQNRDRSFFLYVHTMDAHGPYDPPAPYRKFFEALDGGAPVARDPVYDPEWVATPTAESRQALYDGGLAFGDDRLGRFLDRLAEISERERTLFVFTAEPAPWRGAVGRSTEESEAGEPVSQGGPAGPRR